MVTRSRYVRTLATIVLGIFAILAMLAGFEVERRAEVVDRVRSSGGEVRVVGFLGTDPSPRFSVFLPLVESSRARYGIAKGISFGSFTDPALVDDAAHLLPNIDTVVDSGALPEAQLINYLRGRIYHSNHTAIKTIIATDSRLTDNAMELVGKLRALDALVVHRSAITDNGIAHIRSLPDLRVLSLQGTTVSDIGVQHLVGSAYAQRLVTLDLSRTCISDASVRMISRLPSLESLNISDTAITTGGLLNLTSKRLKTLTVNEAKLSAHSASVIKRHCPRVSIEKL